MHERNLYEDLVASLPVGVYRLRVKAANKWVDHEWVRRLGTNYCIEMASDAFCRILGVTQAQRKANATIVAERIHPDDRPDFITKNVAAMKSLETFQWDGRILKGKKVRWVHFTSVPRPLANGDVLWTGILQDTTEARQAADALRESEARYRSIFEQAGDSIVLLDPRTMSIVDFNNATCKLMGYTREEYARLKITDLEVQETPAEVRRHIKRILGENEAVFETRQKTKRGAVIDLEIRPKVIRINRKEFLQCICRDITGRKRVERQLQASEENLAGLFNGSIEPIMLLDAEGVVLNANSAMCKRMGVAARDFIGRKVFSFLPPDLAKSRLASFRKTVKTGKIHRIEDGRNGRFMESQVCPIPGPSGKVERVAVFVYDITSRVQAETLLRRSNDELEAQVKERTARLRALAVKLTQAEHKERQRIAHVLHEDLQQRLVGIQYKLHSIKDVGPEEPVSRTVQLIMQELADTIQHTRELATHISPPVLPTLGLRAALDWLAKEVQSKCNLEVRVSGCHFFELASSGLRDFAFDAVRELLLNVCKHAAVNSAEIQLWTTGRRQLIIKVSDKGKGGAEIHENPASFGLLSIRERAHALGVEFHIDSPPGKGTCMTLILPTL